MRALVNKASSTSPYPTSSLEFSYAQDFSANVPSLTKPDLCIFIRAITEKYFGESMCVFALDKSTERLKKTHKKLGVTGNQTLIFADLACEQAHLLTGD